MITIGKHLEPDEHHPEPAAGDLRPQHARADRERATMAHVMEK